MDSLFKRLLLVFLPLTSICQHSIDELQTLMVFVHGGTYIMGNNGGKPNARPAHEVILQDFYISKYEVTQKLWHQVMKSDTTHPSYCAECPIYDIKWQYMQDFISQLNSTTGKTFRLPTEAEWEYAARGGKQSRGYKYCGSDSLEDIAWYKPNADLKTHPVGLKNPNELGLYDMSGNVWEMCSDWYDPRFYKRSPTQNPHQNKKKTFRVVRGGSWRSEEERCQSRARNRDVYDHHINNGGFRLVMEVF